eukprot:scaffold1493_cov389-Pinguiococcus_pyrenoidosus.AAC.5
MSPHQSARKGPRRFVRASVRSASLSRHTARMVSAYVRSVQSSSVGGVSGVYGVVPVPSQGDPEPLRRRLLSRRIHAQVVGREQHPLCPPS